MSERVRKRLARVGAIGLKNSVYVLPLSDSATEDFQWIRREIVEGGGDATVLEAQLADALSDAEVEAKFQEAKEAEYVALIQAARAVRMGAGRRRKKGLAEDERDSARSEIARLKRHAEEAAITDFFRAPSGAVLRSSGPLACSCFASGTPARAVSPVRWSSLLVRRAASGAPWIDACSASP